MSTKIPWVRNPDGTPGKSWNPSIGCKHRSTGCANCWAERYARRLAAKGFTRYKEVLDSEGHWNGSVMLQAALRLEGAMRWRKPQTVLVGSMSDLFYEQVADRFIRAVFAVMRDCPQHRFLVLTKRTNRMARVLCGRRFRGEVSAEPLPNVILGFSAENQEWYDKRWQDVQPLVRDGWQTFASLEPMLAPIGISELPYGPQRRDDLSWVIFGSETGSGARPFKADWARAVIADCRNRRIPCFLKQIGKRPDPPIEQLPEDLRIREFPEFLMT